MEKLIRLQQAMMHLLAENEQSKTIGREFEKLSRDYAQLLESNRELRDQIISEKTQAELLLDKLGALADEKKAAEDEKQLLINELDELKKSSEALQPLANPTDSTPLNDTTRQNSPAVQRSDFILASYDWTEKALATDGETWHRTEIEMRGVLNAICNIGTRQGFYFNQMNRQSELDKLFDFYGSDKGSNSTTGVFPYGHSPHTYGDIYEFLFSPVKDQWINIFECGIGSVSENIPSNMGNLYKPGASLRSWRDFFSNGSVFGIDIDPGCVFHENRITTCVADQLSHESIAKALGYFGNQKFDIAIDDGLHTAEACISLFLALRSHLKPNATYVIEDLTPSTLIDVIKFLKQENTNYTVFAGARKYPSSSTEDEVRLDDNFLLVIRVA
jgi:hypothetical protein